MDIFKIINFFFEKENIFQHVENHMKIILKSYLNQP